MTCDLWPFESGSRCYVTTYVVLQVFVLGLGAVTRPSEGLPKVCLSRILTFRLGLRTVLW